jgi:hypothetical protein
MNSTYQIPKGSLTLKKKLKNSEWDFLISKIEKKLDDWKEKLLSTSSRLTQISSRCRTNLLDKYERKKLINYVEDFYGLVVVQWERNPIIL